MSGCQTTGITGTTKSSSSQYQVARDSYTLFFDQEDHLEELIAAGNMQDASILYQEQQTYFDTERSQNPELAARLTQVVTTVTSPHIKDLSTAKSTLNSITWPASESNWQEIRNKLTDAEETITNVPISGIFVNPEFRPGEIAEAKRLYDEKTSLVTASLESDYETFDHSKTDRFFDIHPARIDTASFYSTRPAALTTTLNKFTVAQIGRFADAYGRASFTDSQWKIIGTSYVDRRMSDLPKSSRTLADVLRVVNEASALGLEMDRINAVNVGFVEVTSRTLLDAGQIDFPAAIEVDLPFDISKASVESAFSTSTANVADYLVVFDVALAKASRTIKRKRSQRSQMVVGYEKAENPEYKSVQNELNLAQMSAQNAHTNYTMSRNRYCHGLACIAVAIEQSQAKDQAEEEQVNVQRLMSRLNDTPTMIDVPIKQNYSFTVGEVSATKTMTVHYYVIDRARKRYYKSTFDVVENEVFQVPFELQPTDTNLEKHISGNDSEQDIVEWEREPSSIKMSQLIDDYLANDAKSRRMTNFSALQKEMLTDRNKAIAAYKENTFEGSTANDPRFESVVAVLMPDGGLGSGFYVRPDIVMTNYHVVDEGQFAELQLHDERETFGKVIARDANVDLALIKVQARGTPVRFYNQNKIDLGSTVEVIGHPRGYKFSISRGVVSAVRSAPAATAGYSDPILHVQIDAATSPGNSGGPVFMNDQVVSVVSWGRVDRGSENLNFTVHHSEAEKFLRSALGGS